MFTKLKAFLILNFLAVAIAFFSITEVISRLKSATTMAFFINRMARIPTTSVVGGIAILLLVFYH